MALVENNNFLPKGFQWRCCKCWKCLTVGTMHAALHRKAGHTKTDLNMPAQPAVDQTEWVRMGYTHEAMKKEYRMYASNLVRSAMAPDTMVHAVAANWCTA